MWRGPRAQVRAHPQAGQERLHSCSTTAQHRRDVRTVPRAPGWHGGRGAELPPWLQIQSVAVTRANDRLPAQALGTNICSAGKPHCLDCFSSRARAGGREQHPVVAVRCHQVPLPKHSHHAGCSKASALHGTPTTGLGVLHASLGREAHRVLLVLSTPTGPGPHPPILPHPSGFKSVK